MAQTLNRLAAKTVGALKEPGRYADGGNLYLHVTPRGRSWVFFYRCRRTGRMREMGLGSAATVPLKSAREKAANARSMLANGTDPLSDKRAKRAVLIGAKTFGEYVPEFLGSDDKPGALAAFKNEKHRYQWRQTLTDYAAPLWPIPLREIATEDVRKVLDPIWHTKGETARRLRARIERVLSAAKAKGYREGENPARWRDNLEPIFGKQNRSKAHHPAIPYPEMPAFMRELRKFNSTSASALEFTILTAVRSNETRLMRWEEFDAKEKLWTIPAARMKMKQEHRVPLAPRALEILNRVARPSEREGLVFKGAKPGEPLSDAALLECLRGIAPGKTVHGCRSSFRDWCGEETEYPDSLAEFALAHKITDEVAAAYRRGDGLKRRVQMMLDWSDFLA